MKRRGFTLIEMLIVVAVLVTLMTILFRLMGLGRDSQARMVTITRLQRLENCLSGYFAAFGSYPPVKVQGSRDVYAALDSQTGMQSGSRNENIWNGSYESLYQVDAACRSQPVGCNYPYPDGEQWDEFIALVAEQMKDYVQHELEYCRSEEQREKGERDPGLVRKFDVGGLPFNNLSGSIGRLHNRKDIDWRNIQVFRFGLMSFLLPRYMVMMNGPAELFTEFAQWTENNVFPCDPMTGARFSSWADVRNKATSARQAELAKIANIPSQAACARWMPNLEGICSSGAGDNRPIILYGVHVNSPESELFYRNIDIGIYYPDNSGANPYVLDGITVRDGWGREFYYYSPTPHQRYQLWSAGANGQTFAPWVATESLSAQAKKLVGEWTHDDIVTLSH